MNSAAKEVKKTLKQELKSAKKRVKKALGNLKTNEKHIKKLQRRLGRALYVNHSFSQGSGESVCVFMEQIKAAEETKSINEAQIMSAQAAVAAATANITAFKRSLRHGWLSIDL